MTLEGQFNPESKRYTSKKSDGQSQKPSSAASTAQITIHGPPGVVSVQRLKEKNISLGLRFSS